MKPIIAAVDFSEGDSSALQYAADLALAINADLYLFHVMGIPGSVVEIPLTESFFEEIKESDGKELEKLKDLILKETQGKLKVYIAYKIGNFENELQEYCKIKDPFAVVMGINKTPFEKLLFGSNTLSAIQHLHYPLLAVKDGTKFHAINKVVLACGLEDANRHIPVYYLKELQQAFHLSFGVLNIAPKTIDDVRSQQQLTSLKLLLGELYPTFYFIIADTVEEGISKFLKEENTDLLMLLPKEHGFFEFHKSHVKNILMNTAIPVVTIHD
jgi:nucleotide-binding universal stress UspA family protein